MPNTNHQMGDYSRAAAIVVADTVPNRMLAVIIADTQ
jgi:hypothetical protein